MKQVPVRSARGGVTISTSSSPGASAVVNIPWKNSLAAIQRSPSVDRARRRAPRARARTGGEGGGSGGGTLAPIGPPVRVCGGGVRDRKVPRGPETRAAGEVLGLRSALPGGVQRLFQGPRDDVVERRRLHRLACLGGGADTSITRATRRGASAGAAV